MTTSDLIAYSSLIVAGISAAISAWGLWFTHKQWEKNQKEGNHAQR